MLMSPCYSWVKNIGYSLYQYDWINPYKCLGTSYLIDSIWHATRKLIRTVFNSKEIWSIY